MKLSREKVLMLQKVTLALIGAGQRALDTYESYALKYPYEVQFVAVADVRGNWSNAAKASPMILAKSCHDMDLLLWLAGADCMRISSFGSLAHFTSANAPQGAPLRCLEGCPAAHSCLYYAPNFYLTGEKGWPASVISDDTSMEGLLKALREGPYGRCVYHCDNDVVDHQVVNMEFANAVTAVFTMCAFSDQIHRTVKLLGTQGELKGISSKDQSEIEIIEFASGVHEVISLPVGGGPEGYGGGDFELRKLSISHSLLAFWGARGIFPATQWIAIGAGIAVANANLLLLFAALLSALLGVIFLPAIAWAQRARNRLVR